MRFRLLHLALPGLALLAGCMTEDALRYDGVTTLAGDAIAANSAMQMVDPWPRGVENTRLRVPAERLVPVPAGEAPAPTP